MSLDGISLQNPLEETFGIDPIQEGLIQDAIDKKPVNPGYEETTPEEEGIPPNPPLKRGNRITTNGSVSENFLDESSLDYLEYLNNSEIENSYESNDATDNDTITGEALDNEGNLIVDELAEDTLINPESDAELDAEDEEKANLSLTPPLKGGEQLYRELETEVSATETAPVPPLKRGVRGDRTERIDESEKQETLETLEDNSENEPLTEDDSEDDPPLTPPFKTPSGTGNRTDCGYF